MNQRRFILLLDRNENSEEIMRKKTRFSSSLQGNAVISWSCAQASAQLEIEADVTVILTVAAGSQLKIWTDQEIQGSCCHLQKQIATANDTNRDEYTGIPLRVGPILDYRYLDHVLDTCLLIEVSASFNFKQAAKLFRFGILETSQMCSIRAFVSGNISSRKQINGLD
jgi:hypothetical protein